MRVQDLRVLAHAIVGVCGAVSTPLEPGAAAGDGGSSGGAELAGGGEGDGAADAVGHLAAAVAGDWTGGWRDLRVARGARGVPAGAGDHGGGGTSLGYAAVVVRVYAAGCEAAFRLLNEGSHGGAPFPDQAPPAGKCAVWLSGQWVLKLRGRCASA